MDSVLSNEVARRIAADLATLVSEAEKHGTLPRIKSVAFYFNETELRTIIKLMRSRHGILDPAQDESNYEACSRCGGTGLVLGGAGEPTECSTCKGNTVVRTPAAVEPAQDPCKCDWATGECQGPLGCQAVTASLRTPAGGGDPELMIVGDNDSAGVVPYSANEALAEIDRLREELSQARALVEDMESRLMQAEDGGCAADVLGLYRAIRREVFARRSQSHSSTVSGGDPCLSG